MDYSDSTMQEAQHLLRAVAAFAQDARAYMKGQLVCGPIREDALWERWVLSRICPESPGRRRGAAWREARLLETKAT